MDNPTLSHGKWFGRRKPQPPPADDSTKPSTANLGQAQLAAIRYMVADEAAELAELALRCNDLPVAKETLARAINIDSTLPRITELQACIQLQTGQPQQALDICESARSVTPRIRLLTQLLRCQAGQSAQAHIELCEWSRQPNCPTAARLLLALLDIEQGNDEAARQTLRRNLKRQVDPDTCMAMLLMDIEKELPTSVQQVSGELLHRFAHHPIAQAFLKSFAFNHHFDLAEVPIAMIDQLACELLKQPHVIPTLIVGQKLKPDPARIELIRRAIVRIVEDLVNPMPAIVAISELANLSGDEHLARSWAIRGLKLQPLNAQLALLLNSLTKTEDEDLDICLETMRRLATAHPNYPDVQQALVLRYKQSGLTNLAKQHARWWLKQQPDQPLAKQIHGELAA